MKKAKIFASTLLASLLIFTQVAIAFAAPKPQDVTPISGTVAEVTLETDTNTGITTLLVKLKIDNGGTQTVRISLEAAESPDLGLVTLDADGNPVIVDPLPEFIEIDPATVITMEEHPVAKALALFFSDVAGVDYSAIMDAHTSGNGFGIIAQALFLTKKLGGDATVFQEILQAKQDKNFSSFQLEDGTIPTTWGQLRKAIADKHLGIVMSQKNKDNTSNGGNGNNGNANSSKDKNKDKANNGHGSTNGNSHDNGNGNKP